MSPASSAPSSRDRALDHVVDRVGVPVPAIRALLAVVSERPKHRPVAVSRVPSDAQPRRGAIDRQRVALAALAQNAQRVIAAVLMQISTLSP